MRRCRPLLGTFVEIESATDSHVNAGFAAIERVHALMSAHEPESELSQINRSAHLREVRVSDETRQVLGHALCWWRRSGGVFDVVLAGARALADGRIPRHPEQPVPLADSCCALLVTGNAVRFLEPACIDLGGIAKGYAVDQAVAAMRWAGASQGLVNAGGDLFAFGPQPVCVSAIDPRSRQPKVEIHVANEALATSAILLDGSADHLGSAENWASVTVRAKSACDADALTKIVWALGEDATGLLEAADAVAFATDIRGAVIPLGVQVAA